MYLYNIFLAPKIYSIQTRTFNTYDDPPPSFKGKVCSAKIKIAFM